MIELIVKYVQDKGYEVDVGTGFLIIRKKVGDEVCSISWVISRYILQPEYEKLLYSLADTTLGQLNRAIAERRKGDGYTTDV